MLVYFALNNVETRVSFDYMYNTYSNTVYYMIQKSEKDKNLCDDVMQEIFIKFYKSMGRVQGEEAARRWLMTIAHNEIINHGKSESVYRKHILLDFNEEELFEACSRLVGDVIFEAALKEELGLNVRKEIRQLKPKLQEVIVLKYYFEYTAKEIAYILKCPLDTVYSRLSKAEEILHNTLHDVLCQYYKKEDNSDEQ